LDAKASGSGQSCVVPLWCDAAALGDAALQQVSNNFGAWFGRREMVSSEARWCGRDIEGVRVSDGAGWLWPIAWGW
jgi:hypothetical protein